MLLIMLVFCRVVYINYIVGLLVKLVMNYKTRFIIIIVVIIVVIIIIVVVVVAIEFW